MAARLGRSRHDVVEAALGILEETADPSAVTLGRVAERVGMRTQSLYAHVEGAAGLRRELALAGLRALGDAVTDAALGRSGTDALTAVVRAQLDFAMAHPGLYAAAIHPPGEDPGLRTEVARVTRPLEAVLTSCGLDEEARTHWNRTALATIYGYMLLRRDGQLTLPVDPDATADHIVRMIVTQIELDAA